MHQPLLALLCVSLLTLHPAVADIQLVPFKTPDKLPDVMSLPTPMAAQLHSGLGNRVTASERARLRVVDEDELLAGFRNRPGRQAWVGEHVGKFLHAATIAWANTGDEQLKAKIDRVAKELIKCQDADGYLGTYLPKDHWTSWDVWVHKYNLIGLLTYHQYTGDAAALEASKKMADLLIATFPAKMSIIKAGTHVGMASTSVLEPIVFLYRLTGEQKYLDFAKYIIQSYDEPNGPKVIKSLVELKKVNKTANGKAYEMMSNLVGFCELARATGDKSLLVPVINAWEDVVANQLYITGASSHGEHFGADHELPNNPKANIGETCVTTTWIQLNAQLLRLTGEARYGDELERAYYNHLMGAQLPDGSKWCYYTPLMGTKPYGNSTNCCLSSGPRAIAIAPQLACLKSTVDKDERIAINDLLGFKVQHTLAGQPVTIEMGPNAAIEFPRVKWTIAFTMARPATFAVRVRSPEWAAPLKAIVESTEAEIAGPRGGWLDIPARQWKSGDVIRLEYVLNSRVVRGEHTNQGFAALLVGPVVLAYDAAKNPTLPPPATLALVEGLDGQPIDLKTDPKNGVGARVRTAPDAPPVLAWFVPFAEAGATGSRFQVWMSTTNRPANPSLLASGTESRSRPGNLDGSINDGDPDTVVVTFDGSKKDEDFFAITTEKPATIGRIVYTHGKTFHDGGWFDASADKPQVQIQRTKAGPWETVGPLDTYPNTTATSPAKLKPGQEFTFKLKEPTEVFGIRITGKPACGDNPNQSFSSCAELQGL